MLLKKENGEGRLKFRMHYIEGLNFKVCTKACFEKQKCKATSRFCFFREKNGRKNNNTIINSCPLWYAKYDAPRLVSKSQRSYKTDECFVVKIKRIIKIDIFFCWWSSYPIKVFFFLLSSKALFFLSFERLWLQHHLPYRDKRRWHVDSLYGKDPL